MEPGRLGCALSRGLAVVSTAWVADLCVGNRRLQSPQVPLGARLHTKRMFERNKQTPWRIYERATYDIRDDAFLAVSSLAEQAKMDNDRSTDFRQYKTYSWEGVQTRDPLFVDRIKAAVNANLQTKGWRLLETGGDVAVMAMETTQDHQTLNTFYDGFGGGWRWRGFGGFGESTTTVDTYKVGTLVVDFFDAHTKKLIWRGSASDTLASSSDKNIKTLDKEVHKMFGHFPPGEKN